MSADESKYQPSERQADTQPLAAAEDNAAQEVEARTKSNDATGQEASNPPNRPSRFQRFMHKHFPEAKAHDRWTLVFTAVIAVSTALYTIFAGWTLREIHTGGA